MDFIEKNKYIIETRKDVPDYSQGYNGLASVTYGVTDNLSLNVAAIYDSVQVLSTGSDYIRENKYYVSAALAALFKGVYFNLESVADPDRNSASVDAYIQTNFYGWDLTLENIYYNDILTARNLYNYSAIIENDSQASVNKVLDVFGLFDMPLNYTFRYFSTKEKEHQMENTLSLYKTVWRSLYAGVSYQNTQSLNSENINLLNFNLNHIVMEYNFRGDISYDFIYNKIRTVNATVYHDITEKFRVGLRYSRELTNYLSSDYENKYAASLNWKSPLGYWNAEGGMTDQDAYYAYVGFNISLVFSKKEKKVYSSSDKLYGNGAVLAKVFVDDNKNGVYDKGEKLLPGANAQIVPHSGSVENTTTGKDGCVLIPLVEPYKKMGLEMDLGQIEDNASLVTAGGKKYFKVRPGQIVHIDYPVMGTGDIEGTVKLNGKASKGIIVKLINAETGELVSTRVSEFDGYYLFQALPMGQYKIVLDDAQVKDLRLRYKQGGVINLNKNEQLEVKDISVRRRGSAR